MEILQTNSYDQGIYYCTVQYSTGLVAPAAIMEDEYLKIMHIEIEEFIITGWDIEIIWFREQDKESRATSFELNEAEMLSIIRDNHSDYDEWYESYLDGSLLEEFYNCATNKHILPLLNHHLEQTV